MMTPLLGIGQEANSVYPEDKTEGLVNSSIFTDYQNFFVEWRLYLKDCNQLVADTVEQYGTVHCKLLPVKMNGAIVSYNTVPIDTVWDECECREYKSYFNLYAGKFISSTTTGLTISSSGFYTYSEPKPAKNTFSIQRDKVCQIKKQKASLEDFIERWCVERKLIEMN